MNRVWKDIEAVIQKKDENEYDNRKNGKLDGSADLPRN